jgi:hypothetical protein
LSGHEFARFKTVFCGPPAARRRSAAIEFPLEATCQSLQAFLFDRLHGRDGGEARSARRELGDQRVVAATAAAKPPALNSFMTK